MARILALDQGIEDLTVTDESFEPQFVIELTKAGEVHDSLQYGGKGNRIAEILGTPTLTRRPPSRIRAPHGMGLATIKHVFACPRCGKKFYRKDRFNSMIARHKLTKYSRYDDCFGGFGQYLGQRR